MRLIKTIVRYTKKLLKSKTMTSFMFNAIFVFRKVTSVLIVLRDLMRLKVTLRKRYLTFNRSLNQKRKKEYLEI